MHFFCVYQEKIWIIITYFVDFRVNTKQEGTNDTLSPKRD